MFRQIRSVNCLRFAGLTGRQQGGAEIVANGNRPEGRFGVREILFQPDGISERFESLVVLTAVHRQLTGQESLSDFEQSPFGFLVLSPITA
jgi:hypothetical protein